MKEFPHDDSISTVVGDEALGLVSATVTVTTSQDSTTTSAQENGSRPQTTSGNIPTSQVISVVKLIQPIITNLQCFSQIQAS
jgi:hypothetical protein